MSATRIWISAVCLSVCLSVWQRCVLRRLASSASWTGGNFSLNTNLAAGTILAAILVASIKLQERFRGEGVSLAAMVVGLVNTHTAAISVAALLESGKVAPQGPVLPILIVIGSITETRIMMTTTGGVWTFALWGVPGLVLVAVTA